ncbi:hypothetical protein C6341_g20557 [Phytophthora cactorum]|nr:hypothetical protein C6341_g20557 [Phytophthora cactorum]
MTWVQEHPLGLTKQQAQALKLERQQEVLESWRNERLVGR